MNQFFLVFCFVLIMGSVSAQNQSLIMDLYPGEIPFQKVTQVKEVSKSEGIVRISNVQTPQIQVFLPSKSSANGQAVIICPGGGYGILAYDWEGTHSWNRFEIQAAFSYITNESPPCTYV